MVITASKLRSNIYKILDHVLETGQSINISRRGKIIKIMPPAPMSKLDRIKKPLGKILCDPEELVHIDWSHEWKPDL